MNVQAGTPAACPSYKKAGGFCDIGESAIAVVAVEHVLTVVGDEDILETVIVVIADGDACSPTGPNETSLFGYVFECAVAIVPVQAVRSARGDGGCVETAAVQHENVEPAIVIVVEEGDAAAGCFEDVIGMVDGSIDDGMREAGRGCNVGELREEGNTGGLAASLRFHSARG